MLLVERNSSGEKFDSVGPRWLLREAPHQPGKATDSLRRVRDLIAALGAYPDLRLRSGVMLEQSIAHVSAARWW